MITEPRVGARRPDTTTRTRGDIGGIAAPTVTAVRDDGVARRSTGPPYGGRASGGRRQVAAERRGRAAAPCSARPPQVLLGAVRCAGQRRRCRRCLHGGGRRGAAALGAPRRVSRGRRGGASSEETLAACAAGLALAASALGGPVARRLPAASRCSSRSCSWCCTWSRRRRPPGRWPPGSRRSSPSCAASTGCRTRCTPSSTCASPSLGLGIALFGRRVVGRLGPADDGAVVAGRAWSAARRARGRTTARAVVLRRADDRGRVRAAAGPAARAAGAAARARRASCRWSPGSSPARRSPGAFSSLGPLAMTFTGYAGVLLANTAAASLTGWRRGLFLPVALAGGSSMAALCLVSWSRAGGGRQLSLLLLLTAIPTALVAVRRPTTGRWRCRRRSAAWPARCCWHCPTACSDPVAAAAAASPCSTASRWRSARLSTPRAAGDGAGGGAVRRCRRSLLLGRRRRGTTLAAVLAVQGACTLGWAWRTRPRPDRRGGGRRRTRGLARWRGPARAGRLGRPRPPPACPPSSGTRCPAAAGLLSRPGRGCGTARPGRRGGRACWSRPCRRRVLAVVDLGRHAGGRGAGRARRWSMVAGAGASVSGRRSWSAPGPRWRWRSASPSGRCPGRWAPRWSSAACCSRSGCGGSAAGRRLRRRLADLQLTDADAHAARVAAD